MSETENLRHNRKIELMQVCNGRIHSAYSPTQQMNMLIFGEDLSDLKACINAHKEVYAEHLTTLGNLGHEELEAYDLHTGWPESWSLEQENLVDDQVQDVPADEQSADDEAGSDEGVHAVSPEQDATLTPDAGDLQDIRDAYEASHDIPDYLTGIDDVDAVVSADPDLGSVSGEPVEAALENSPDSGGDFSAEPVGDDSALGGADSHSSVMVVGDALATAKAMAMMSVDDERFTRVGDYDKAANQSKLDELRQIQQAIKEGVHPAFTDAQTEELQALETFMPFTQRIDDHAQALRNAIREAEDLEQLTAIDILSGWPD